MIELTSITKYYDQFKALDNISFTIEGNKITCLIGKNGAGKTTIIKCINRILKPDNGTIILNKRSIFTLKAEEYRISYIPDIPIYFEELSTYENLIFIGKVYRKDRNVINEMIDKMSLGEYCKISPAKLSKGNQQKLSIAIALLRDFDILIADEPFTGLDPEQIEDLKNIFIDLKKSNKTIIISSHLLDLAETFTDNFIFIDHGKLLKSGSKQEFIQPEFKKSLQEFFVETIRSETKEV